MSRIFAPPLPSTFAPPTRRVGSTNRETDSKPFRLFVAPSLLPRVSCVGQAHKERLEWSISSLVPGTLVSIARRAGHKIVARRNKIGVERRLSARMAGRRYFVCLDGYKY